MSSNERDTEIQKANEFRLAGQYDEAIAILQDVVVKSPFLAPAKLLLGRAYFESGRHGQALDTLEEFIDFVPEHMLANKILARLYFSQKKLDLARQSIEVVLEQNPSDRICNKLLQEMDDLKLVSSELDETVKTDRPVLTATMAELYYHQGHFEEARKIYQSLVHENPTNESYQEKLRQVENTIEGDSVKVVSHPVHIDSDPTEKLPLSRMQKRNASPNQQKKKELENLLQRVQMRRKKANV